MCVNRAWHYGGDGLRPPLCVKSGCGDLSPPSNGQLITKYRNSYAEIVCNPGHEISGTFNQVKVERYFKVVSLDHGRCFVTYQ